MANRLTISNAWVDTFEGEGLLRTETYQHEIFQPGLTIGRLHTQPAGTSWDGVTSIDTVARVHNFSNG